jgi:PTH2 family peptidyl-tRNA hydrolase
MTCGKMCSQSSHAALGAFINANADLQTAYHSEFPEHPGTKICLTAKSLDRILIAKEMADAAGIPAFLVTDSGCSNFFDGKPTITALGLGPATKDQIKHITRRFQLL